MEALKKLDTCCEHTFGNHLFDSLGTRKESAAVEDAPICTCATVSDLRLCADKNCENVISYAKSLGKHTTFRQKDPLLLAFDRGVVIKIMSKSAGTRKDLWGGELDGKRGYFPRSFVREYKVEIPNPNHIVPTEPFQVEEVEEKKEEETETVTEKDAKDTEAEVDETEIVEDDTEIGDETEIIEEAEKEVTNTEEPEKGEEEVEIEQARKVPEHDELEDDDYEEEEEEYEEDDEDEGYEDENEREVDHELEREKNTKDDEIGEKEDKVEVVENGDGTIAVDKFVAPTDQKLDTLLDQDVGDSMEENQETELDKDSIDKEEAEAEIINQDETDLDPASADIATERANDINAGSLSDDTNSVTHEEVEAGETEEKGTQIEKKDEAQVTEKKQDTDRREIDDEMETQDTENEREVTQIEKDESQVTEKKQDIDGREINGEVETQDTENESEVTQIEKKDDSHAAEEKHDTDGENKDQAVDTEKVTGDYKSIREGEKDSDEKTRTQGEDDGDENLSREIQEGTSDDGKEKTIEKDENVKHFEQDKAGTETHVHEEGIQVDNDEVEDIEGNKKEVEKEKENNLQVDDKKKEDMEGNEEVEKEKENNLHVDDKKKENMEGNGEVEKEKKNNLQVDDKKKENIDGDKKEQEDIEMNEKGEDTLSAEKGSETREEDESNDLDPTAEHNDEGDHKKGTNNVKKKEHDLFDAVKNEDSREEDDKLKEDGRETSQNDIQIASDWGKEEKDVYSKKRVADMGELDRGTASSIKSEKDSELEDERQEMEKELQRSSEETKDVENKITDRKSNTGEEDGRKLEDKPDVKLSVEAKTTTGSDRSRQTGKEDGSDILKQEEELNKILLDRSSDEGDTTSESESRVTIAESVKESESDGIEPTEVKRAQDGDDTRAQSNSAGSSYSPVVISVTQSQNLDSASESISATDPGLPVIPSVTEENADGDFVVIDGTSFPKDILEPTPSSSEETSSALSAEKSLMDRGISATEDLVQHSQTQTVYEPDIQKVAGLKTPSERVDEHSISETTATLDRLTTSVDASISPSKLEPEYILATNGNTDGKVTENVTHSEKPLPKIEIGSIPDKIDAYKSEYVSRKPLAHGEDSGENVSVNKKQSTKPFQPLADVNEQESTDKLIPNNEELSVVEKGETTPSPSEETKPTWPSVGDEIPIPPFERDVTPDPFADLKHDESADVTSKAHETDSTTMKTLIGSQMSKLELVMKRIIDKLPPSLQTVLEQEPLGLSPQLTVLVSIISVSILATLTCCGLLCKRGSKNKKVDPLVVIHGLEEKLFVTTKEKENLEDDLDVAKKKIIELESDMEFNQSSAGTLETDLQNYKFHIEAMKKAINTLKEELADKESELLENQMELEKNNTKIQELSSQLEDMSTNHEDTERKYKEAVKDAGTRTNEINTLQVQSQNLTDQVHHLETRKQQLLKEADDWNEKVQDLSERLSQSELEKHQMQEDKAFIENELQVLRDCFLQIKSFENDQDNSMGDDDTTTQDKMKAMVDVSRVNATLQAVEEERNMLHKKLEFQTQDRQEMEEQIAQLERRIETLQTDKMKADRQCQESQTKLNVLSNYFKEKEIELQKELGEHQAIKRMNIDQLGSATEKTKQIEEELDTYRQQTEDLKREIASAERDFRNQIAANEKKAHENWLAARAAERELKESKHESTVLRHKLTDLERRLFDGPVGVIRPLPTRGMPPPGMLNGPPHPGMSRSPIERPGSRNSVHAGPPPPGLREDGVLSPADDRYPPPPLDRRPPGPPGPRMPPPFSHMGRRSPPPFDKRPLPPMDRRSPPPFDRRPPPPGYRPPPPEMLPPPHGPPPHHPRAPFTPLRMEPPGMDSQRGGRGPSPYNQPPGPGREKGHPRQQSQV
ncbi:hypothetical protein ScPMuIL_014962 [Solemya velum]